MDTRVTSNETDIMQLCNFVKNDAEKARIDYLTAFKSSQNTKLGSF